MAAPARSGPPARVASAWDAVPLERAISIRDGHTGADLDLELLLDQLAGSEAVFLGETHLDETTHRVELAVYEGLLARRPGQVVLAMEMFERDVQPLLDQYLAGEIDEATFLAAARPWGNYTTAYRPLIEAARRAGAPVVASNFPAPLRRKLMSTQAESLAALDTAERANTPAQLLPNSEAYWRRVDNAIRGHARAMGLPDPAPEARLMSTQSLWDNAMGEACALTLERNPGVLVLHVNGGFHSEYWDGTLRQLLARRPETRVASVAITPTVNPAVAELEGAPRADFVVFAEALASDIDSGSYGVSYTSKLDYRLHMPAGSGPAHRVPLLVWLPPDGLDSQDGLDLWVARLGESCAIAVFDAPYREQQDDLSPGRRWFWSDTFSEDAAAATGAVARAIGFIARYRDIDPARILIAGEGSGASVAVAAGLALDGVPLSVLAWTPNALRNLSDLPLPLVELRGDLPPRQTALRVVVSSQDLQAWQAEADAYRSVGVDVTLEGLADDPWQVEAELERALRTGLGLEPRALDDSAMPRFAVASGVRARQWARLSAARKAPDVRVALLDAAPVSDQAEELVLAVGPEQVLAGAQLPRAPGSFGGTTLIVLSADTEPEQVEAWLALEANDPLTARSRFDRMRVASLDPASPVALAAVLTRQVSDGRRNVLLVPAEFCADSATMRALATIAEPFKTELDLHYRPGLGGL